MMHTPPPPNVVIGIVDMHNAVFRSFHALRLAITRAGKEGDPAPDVTLATLRGTLNTMATALHGPDSPLRYAAREAGRSGGIRWIYCWDGGGRGFRHEAFPGYKEGRQERPPALDEAVDLAKASLTDWPSIRVLGHEADDVIATIVKLIRRSTWGGVPIALFSSDRDLLQLQDHAKVYQWFPLGGYKGWMDETTFHLRAGFHPRYIPDYKALAGDDTDGIPGVKGFGEKYASHLIASYGYLEAIFGAVPKTIEDGRILRLLTPENEAAALGWRKLTRLMEDVPGVGLKEALPHPEGGG